MSRLFSRTLAFSLLALVLIQPSQGLTKSPREQPRQPENNPAEIPPIPEDRSIELGKIIQRLDAEAEKNGNSWVFMIEGSEVTLVFDTRADRMRLIVPIVELADIKEGQLLRMMQANFDSALDARYAIAHGVVWGVFIHPLNSLTDRDFISGIGQTVNVALTFGGSYSSGELVFGGGDSQGIERRRLIEELQKKGQGV